MPTMETRIVHKAIDRAWRDVYAFASDPERMPLWAAGLASGLQREGDDWIASGPLGSVRVHFVEPNDYGVIDHIVTMPDGLEVYNALRITPNGDGAEISFTVLKLPGMSSADFDRDAGLVQADLEKLKTLLEAHSSDT
ncbi:SRPBCC family protein [Agrobacterium larrymoorei]|uniref:SRPBCC family protein n=1 Tax=Agrobacterium larrymoorei TaxID=160699 RepID=UPI001573C667|nr:SRPBCC family protein [Agrobacterium larrymoorei]NTJ42496.1 SRPBCC family protein [Agrobacterium larrymoorei]